MEKKKPNFNRLRARLEQWCKLYPRDRQFIGAVTKREVDAARTAVCIDHGPDLYFLHCGNCGNEDIVAMAEAILHHRIGDPTFLCSACSEAYDACARQMLREHLTAPAALRSAWARIRSNGGRGTLVAQPERPPKSGDPVRN